MKNYQISPLNKYIPKVNFCKSNTAKIICLFLFTLLQFVHKRCMPQRTYLPLYCMAVGVCYVGAQPSRVHRKRVYGYRRQQLQLCIRLDVCPDYCVRNPQPSVAKEFQQGEIKLGHCIANRFCVCVRRRLTSYWMSTHTKQNLQLLRRLIGKR